MADGELYQTGRLTFFLNGHRIDIDDPAPTCC